MRLLITISVMVMLVVACGQSQSTTSAKREGWITFELGSPALIIQLPGEVTAKSSPVDNETLQVLKRTDTYQYLHPSNMVMGIFQFAEYTTPMAVTPMEAMMHGMRKMFDSLQSTDANFKTEDLTFLNRPGVKAHGGFTWNAQPWKFNTMVIVDGARMWQMWLAANANSPDHLKMMQDMFESVGFKE